MQEELAHCLRAAFDWSDISVSRGPRGAEGQVWRVQAGPRGYAVKEMLGSPPRPAVLDAELAFARDAQAVGVRVPASHPDRTGGYVVGGPAGAWLRVYDWIDLRPVDPSSPG